MTDTQTITLIAGFVAVCLIAVWGCMDSRRNTERLLTHLAQHTNRAQLDTNALMLQLVEKLQTDQVLSMKQHAHERMHAAELQTSLERESLRLGRPRPAPQPPQDWDRDGVPTTNLDEARGV